MPQESPFGPYRAPSPAAPGLGRETGTIALPVLPIAQHTGAILCIIFGVLILVVGAVLAFGDENLGPTHPGVLALAALGFVPCAAGIALLQARARAKGRIVLHEQGLVVQRPAGAATVLWSDVVGIALLQKEVLSNGTRIGWLRRLTLRTAAGSTKIVHYAPSTSIGQDGVTDPFGAFVDQLITRLADAADVTIKNGGSLRGPGWMLDGAGLQIGSEGAAPMSSLAQVSLFEKTVAIFRRSEALPFFTVKEEAENARLLFDLIQRRLPDRIEDAVDAEGLGRLLFRKSGSKVIGIVLLFFFAPMVAGGIVMGLGPSSDLGPALTLGGVGAVLTLLALYTMANKFEAHEKGIAKKSLFGRRALPYSELRGFSYGAVRHYHNGAYMGTQVSLSFTPAAGKPVKFGARLTGSDADLDFLRERVSALVANRLGQQVVEKGEVDWAGKARLFAGGVRFEKSRLLGKGEPVTALFSRGLRYGISDGVFMMTDPESGAVLKLQCSGHNFYPGFILFEKLARAAAGS